jgi:heme A synthase
MSDSQTSPSAVTERIHQLTGSWVRYTHFAGVTLGLTYVLMLLGAYTSAIGAGLSCPDWPTCYGTWVPFLHPEIAANAPYSAVQIFAEWAHRGLAMIVGVLVLGTTLAAWRFQRNRPVVTWSATLALVVLPIQVALGRFTVTALLQPVVVTAHLGTAVLILLALTVTTVSAWLYDHRKDAVNGNHRAAN